MARKSCVFALAFVNLMVVVGTTQAQDVSMGSGQGGTYAGVFAGLGAVDVQMTDVDGFSGSEGVPGRTYEYDDTGLSD